MGIKIGFTGAGGFVGAFIPLFQAHPLVDSVAIADLNQDKAKERAERFGIEEVYASHDELCRSDVDAICIFTQRWTHGPLALQALRAGKHVYSAVPAGVTVEEIQQLVEVVEETGLIYMLGETSYYYPNTIYCRQRFRRGDMGLFTYGEACYYHDMSHGFYEGFQRTGGANWKPTASVPPMLYPTHSTSMIVSVTGAHMTDVSCLGWVDQHDDGVFDPRISLWQNAFSNEASLMRSSDGGMVRINEFRRVGWRGGRTVHLSLYGTEACYEEQSLSCRWCEREKGREMSLDDLLRCAPKDVPAGDADEHAAGISKRELYCGLAPVHDASRLPKEFRGMNNGHEGSHQFLVDDFVKAVASGVQPVNHVWAAARYNLPGIIAHESAKRDGERLPIPDLGWPAQAQVGDWLELPHLAANGVLA